jgi:hypothetical protein
MSVIGIPLSKPSWKRGSAIAEKAASAQEYRRRDDVVRYLAMWAALLARELHESQEAMQGRRGADQGGERVPHGATVATSAPELSRPGSDDVDDMTCLGNGEPSPDGELGDGDGVGTAETTKTA